MSRAFQHETHRRGWMIPTSMQLVPVVMLAIGLPFAPGEAFSTNSQLIRRVASMARLARQE